MATGSAYDVPLVGADFGCHEPPRVATKEQIKMVNALNTQFSHQSCQIFMAIDLMKMVGDRDQIDVLRIFEHFDFLSSVLCRGHLVLFIDGSPLSVLVAAILVGPNGLIYHEANYSRIQLIRKAGYGHLIDRGRIIINSLPKIGRCDVIFLDKIRDGPEWCERLKPSGKVFDYKTSEELDISSATVQNQAQEQECNNRQNGSNAENNLRGC